MGKLKSKSITLINNALKEIEDDYIKNELSELDEDEIREILDVEENFYSSAILSSTLSGLSYDEIKSIKVTENSIFDDNNWIIPSKEKSTNLYFEYDFHEFDNTKNHPELIFFIKCLTLFRIPDHTDNVTSNRTALMELFTIKRFISFCFLENQLLNPIIDCSRITLNQINKALDLSRDEGAHANYREVAKGLRHWINLTNGGVLPYELMCPFAESEIFTDIRVKEIIKHNLEMGTYLPLSEDEIVAIADNTFKWIEVYSEDICFLNEHLNLEENITQYSKNNLELPRVAIHMDSTSGEEILNREYAMDIKKNCSWFVPDFGVGKFASEKILLTKRIREDSKNLIGACISIILLITGMRIRELQTLKVGCCKHQHDDLYTLNYKIFKTAHDAEVGEDVSFPVPQIVNTAVSLMERLLAANRKEINSDYLFVGYEHRKVSYKYCESQTLRRLLRRIVDDEIKRNIHPHRFRKTIAWLLISRSERNIDIIRQLFGHRSYKMTLEYILRNYELVDEVVNQLRVHYAQEFYDLTKSLITGHYTGPAAERLAKSIKSNSTSFNAQLLRITLAEYVTALLESGEPLFIHRVPVGGWCLSVPVIGAKPTPCTAKLKPAERVAPDTRFCKYEDCDKFAGTADAIPGIERNINFYKKILGINSLEHSLRKKYEHKLTKNLNHLNNIKSARPLFKTFDTEDLA